LPAATVPTDAQAAHSYSSQAVASNDAAQIDAAPAQYQSNTGTSTAGYNPQIINSVNYSDVTPDRSIPCGTTNTTLRTGIAYTVVGEAHAYRDATTYFEYNNTLSTTFGVAYSTDGKIFKINGSVSHSNNTGHAISVTEGPNWGHQITVPIQYAETESNYLCGGIVKSRTYKILPIGYDVPAGGSIAQIGANVSSSDGASGYAHSNPKYRSVIPPHFSAAITGGNSITYGAGASAFGVAISTSTTYNSNHTEKITAGGSTATHNIWGAHGQFSDDPGVLYSY
jgi:hypothetical protein